MWIPEPVSTWKERKSHFTPVVIIYTHTIRKVTKMTVIEKVAYLRGLADGLKLTDTTAEGKVLLNVIEVLDDLALSVTDLEDAVEELGEVVDAIDDDLQDVEDALYEEDDEDEDYDFDEDDDYGLDDYDEFDDEDEPLYEVKCPTCGDTICVDESMLCEGEIDCPNCGEKLEFDLDDLDCEGDCEGCTGCDLD